MMKLNLEDDRYCFACGEKNPYGLKLKFSKEEDKVWTELKIQKWMQGYKDIAHGGIIGLVLDEVIVNACYLNGLKAVSAELNIRLKKPCFVGEKIKFIGKILERKKRIIICKAEALREGEIVAEAKGKCVVLNEEV